MESEEGSREIVAKVSISEEGSFKIVLVRAPKGDVSLLQGENFADDFEEYFNKARLEALNVSKEQVEYVAQPTDCEIVYISENGEINEEEEGLDTSEYSFVYSLLFVVTLLISFSGQKLATSIVVEKSTRVIEYLTINVRPLALLFGKLLATLLLVLVQLLELLLALEQVYDQLNL